MSENNLPVDSVTRLGAAIRDRRLALGWTQAQLAARAGVSRQWVVALEAGAPRAEMVRVMEVAAALELSFYLGPAAPRPQIDFTDLELDQ